MNFSEMKDRLLSGLGKAADAGKDIANKAADKAKAGTRIAKLTMEISSEKENMKKAYLEIGKLYYDTHKDDPEGLDSTITATPDFKTLKRWFPGAPEGIVPLKGRLAFAITPRLPDRSFGAILYPFQTEETREIAWPAKHATDRGGRVK